MQQSPGLEDRETRILDRPTDRLRKNYYHLWAVLRELRASPSPEALLEAWEAAEKPSQGWRKACFYSQAIGVLTVAVGCTREETEALVRQYITEGSTE